MKGKQRVSLVSHLPFFTHYKSIKQSPKFQFKEFLLQLSSHQGAKFYYENIHCSMKMQRKRSWAQQRAETIGELGTGEMRSCAMRAISGTWSEKNQRWGSLLFPRSLSHSDDMWQPVPQWWHVSEQGWLHHGSLLMHDVDFKIQSHPRFAKNLPNWNS